MPQSVGWPVAPQTHTAGKVWQARKYDAIQHGQGAAGAALPHLSHTKHLPASDNFSATWRLISATPRLIPVVASCCCRASGLLLFGGGSLVTGTTADVTAAAAARTDHLQLLCVCLLTAALHRRAANRLTLQAAAAGVMAVGTVSCRRLPSPATTPLPTRNSPATHTLVNVPPKSRPLPPRILPPPCHHDAIPATAATAAAAAVCHRHPLLCRVGEIILRWHHPHPRRPRPGTTSGGHHRQRRRQRRPAPAPLRHTTHVPPPTCAAAVLAAAVLPSQRHRNRMVCTSSLFRSLGPIWWCRTQNTPPRQQAALHEFYCAQMPHPPLPVSQQCV